MLRRIRIITVLFALLGLMLACDGGGGGSSDSSSGGDGGETGGGTDAGETFQAPAPAAGTGQLMIDVGGTGLDPNSYQGYVVGSQDLVVQPTGDGRAFINNVPPGTIDIVLLANEASAALTQDAPSRGIRVNDQAITDGNVTTLPVTDVPPLGRITGFATLMNQTDHAGIDAYIPGTTYIAKTAPEGRYSMDGVPVGVHDLFFDKDGYGRAILAGIEVTSGTESTHEEVRLLLDVGPSGRILIENGADVITYTTVKVDIAPGDGAVLMMLSEDPDFNNISWQPVKSVVNYTFNSGGAKTLYARFADANGLESTPVSDTISIDNAGPTGTISINGGNPFTNSVNATMNIDVTDELSDMTDIVNYGFTEALDNPLTAGISNNQASIALQPSDGLQTVYAQFFDSSSNASDVFSATITLDTANPEMASITPAANASFVDFDETITVEFDEIMSSDSLNSDNLKLKVGSDEIPINITENTTTTTSVDLKPASDTLFPRTVYTTEVLGVEDRAGNAPLASYTPQFTTKPGWIGTTGQNLQSTDIADITAAPLSEDNVMVFYRADDELKARIFSRISGWAEELDVDSGVSTSSVLQSDSCGNGDVVVSYEQGGDVIVARYVSANSTWDTTTYLSAAGNIVAGAAKIACSKMSNSGKSVVVTFGTSTNRSLEILWFNGTMVQSIGGIDLTGSGTTSNNIYVAMSGQDTAIVGHYNSATSRHEAYHINDGVLGSKETLFVANAPSANDSADAVMDLAGNGWVFWQEGNAPSGSCSMPEGIVAGQFYDTAMGWGSAGSVFADAGNCAVAPKAGMTAAGDTFLMVGAGAAIATPSLLYHDGSSWSSPQAVGGVFAFNPSGNSDQLVAIGDSAMAIYTPGSTTFSWIPHDGSDWASAIENETVSPTADGDYHLAKDLGGYAYYIYINEGTPDTIHAYVGR